MRHLEYLTSLIKVFVFLILYVKKLRPNYVLLIKVSHLSICPEMFSSVLKGELVRRYKSKQL